MEYVQSYSTVISEITHVLALNKEINNNGVYHDITMVHIQPK